MRFRLGFINCQTFLTDTILHRMKWNYQTTQTILVIENQYYQVEAKFNGFLHPVFDPPLSRHSSPCSNLSGHSNNSPRSHASTTHIKLPVIALPTFECETGSWLNFRDTFETLVLHNIALSNVQKYHLLIALFKDEAKNLISTLYNKYKFSCCLVTSITTMHEKD